jgi:hypothetical protein
VNTREFVGLSILAVLLLAVIVAAIVLQPAMPLTERSGGPLPNPTPATPLYGP